MEIFVVIGHAFIRVFFVFGALIVIAIDLVADGLRSPLVHHGLTRPFASLVVAAVPALSLIAVWNMFRGFWRLAFTGVLVTAITRLTFTAVMGMLR